MDSQRVLFPDVGEKFAHLVAFAERLAGIYNDDLAVALDHQQRLLSGAGPYQQQVRLTIDLVDLSG